MAELTAELNSHKMKLSEQVVEGFGDKIEEIGEIIEDTFKDKKIATKFGEKDDEVEAITSAVQSKLSLGDENVIAEDGGVEDSSPNKRKVAEKLGTADLSSGEVADVEVTIERSTLILTIYP